MDAWRRLKKNRMAIFGMALVIFYSLLSLLAAILPIHSFKHQVLDHQYLPPSLTKTAGELLYERQENTLMDAAKNEGRNELNEKEKEELSVLKQRIENETMVFDGKTVKVHQKRYFLGTDALRKSVV